jgi:GPH family glycoside/pentoside/hexuronide:cation symporter
MSVTARPNRPSVPDVTSGRRSNWILAAFAGPSLPFAALGLPLIVHLPAFYAQSVGLPLQSVSLMFFIARTLDIGADPFLGGWMDRTRGRFGRFKPWLVAGALPMMIATWLLFMPPKGANLVFLTLCLLAVYVTFSIVVLAQTSWAATLSTDYDQRSRVYGWWQFGNMVGMLLVLLLPPIISARGGTQAQGVAAMGWFIVVLLPITVGIAVWKVPEPRPETECHATIADYFAFFKLSSVRRLMLTDLLYGLAPGITGALALFYLQTVKGMSEGQASILIFCYFVGGLVGAPIWGWAATKFGKHKALSIAGVVYAAAYVVVWLAPAHNLAAQVGSMLFVGIPFGAGQILLRAMMADVGDEERLASGEDRTGMMYALLTLTNKVGTALSSAVLFILSLSHYDQAPGAHNSSAAINTLTFLFVALPILVLIVSSMIINRFPIDETRQKQTRAALEARDGAR